MSNLWYLSLSAACECVQYVGDGPMSHGVFTSPNYPQIYETNINCVLYTFMGDDDELVQLTFTDFDMELSITNKYAPLVSTASCAPFTLILNFKRKKLHCCKIFNSI